MATFKLTLPAGSLSGSFTLNVGGTATGAISAPGSASTIQAAIRAVSGEDEATVRGSTGGPFTIVVKAATLTVDDANVQGKASGENYKVEDITQTQNPAAAGSTDLDSLRQAKGKLIRKALGGVVLFAPMTVPVPEVFFTDDAKLVNFRNMGYFSLGWLQKSSGINFSRETEQSDVESFGAQEPTRTDFTKDVTSAAFVMQETSKGSLEFYYNVDLSKAKIGTNSELSFTQDNIPKARYRRMLYIAEDSYNDLPIYIIKVMPKAIVSEVQENAWSADSEISYSVTLKASRDDELDYAVKHVFGGEGWKALAADMGFVAG